MEEMRSQLPSLKQAIEMGKKGEDYSFYIGKLRALERVMRKPMPQEIKEILVSRLSSEIHGLLKLNKPLTYNDYSVFTEPGSQIEMFMKYSQSFDDKKYWKELADAYTLQDYKKISLARLKSLFAADRKFRNNLMNGDERGFLKKLPAKVTIYRGGSPNEAKKNKYGLSWTLKRSIARKFADKKQLQTGKEMHVLKKTISKSKVIAYFNQRQEEEIIYLGD